MRIDEDPQALAALRAAALRPSPDDPRDVDGAKAARALRLSLVSARGWRRSRGGEYRDPRSDHTCPLAQAFDVELLRERKRIVAEATGLAIPVDEVRTARVVVDGAEMTLGEAMELLAPTS